MKQIKRRRFIQGCCAGIMAWEGTHIGNLAFSADPGEEDTLIVIFLRGAMDALSVLAPHGDSLYHAARPDLALTSSDVIDLDGYFGLHPRMAPFKELMDNGDGAIVMATGMNNPTRSHFEAQDFMERGKPGDAFFSGGGWLARHLNLAPTSSIFQGISIGSNVDVSMEKFDGALAMDGAENFTLKGSSGWHFDIRRALEEMYGNDAAMGPQGMATLDATQIIEDSNPGEYQPQNGAVYPDTSIGAALKSVAQLIRLDLGLRAVTIDNGGWDTHRNQVQGDPAAGYFGDLIGDLAEAIHAFWTDMADKKDSISLATMSEFGRRFKENNNRGCDHGHGSMMMLLSGSMRNPGLHGTWPGVSNEQLFEHVDLNVTTDYRQVLSELLIARTRTADLTSIFPGYEYEGPLGIFYFLNSAKRNVWSAYQ